LADAAALTYSLNLSRLLLTAPGDPHTSHHQVQDTRKMNGIIWGRDAMLWPVRDVAVHRKRPLLPRCERQGPVIVA